MASTFLHLPWSAVFMIAGTVLSAVAVLLAILSLRTKLRARRSLVSVLSNDQEFVNALAKTHAKKMLDEGNDGLTDEVAEALQKLIAVRLATLPIADQQLLAPPLRQPSDTGRSRYIGSLVQDVDMRLHHAA